ncbi:MAG: acylphosphatase [Armatimonadota bacterium]
MKPPRRRAGFGSRAAEATEAKLAGPARFRAVISGTVQMVGFRAFAESRAEMRGITGYVRNVPSGEVEVVAEGDKVLLEEFLAELRRGPSGARVRDMMVSWEQARGEFGEFAVRYGAW